MTSFAPLRLAKETQPGSFVVVEGATLTLTLEPDTLTVTAAPAQTVLHLALSACMFGSSDMRIMIVPKDRGPAFIFEFAEANQARNCRNALLERRADVTDAAPRTQGITTEELTSLMGIPGFARYLQEAEAALARRGALQLPVLL